ncbi:MAG: hypothetical protein P8L78_16095 [Mariniblastus sp.]|nr:hypothetical protein [Mariniblastus sp.]
MLDYKVTEGQRSELSDCRLILQGWKAKLRRDWISLSVEFKSWHGRFGGGPAKSVPLNGGLWIKLISAINFAGGCVF